MFIKASLFVCVIAAGVGCRNDRNSRELPYSRTVESPEQGERNTLSTDRAGNTVHDTSTPPAAGTEPLNDDSDTSSMPNRDSTGANVATPGTGQGAGATAPTPSASPVDTAAQSHHESRDAGISKTMQSGERGPMTPSTGVSETASGNGTTTNTGTNSENQGTGTTDDPTR
jgi:hypothetical protein